MADITMPQLGETVTEGTITKWFKQVGDQVAEDEALFEVSTDKVDSEVPSPAAGFLTEIQVPEGDTVDVGAVLAVISADAGAAAPAPAPAEAAPAAGTLRPRPSPSQRRQIRWASMIGSGISSSPLVGSRSRTSSPGRRRPARSSGYSWPGSCCTS